MSQFILNLFLMKSICYVSNSFKKKKKNPALDETNFLCQWSKQSGLAWKGLAAMIITARCNSDSFGPIWRCQKMIVIVPQFQFDFALLVNKKDCDLPTTLSHWRNWSNVVFWLISSVFSISFWNRYFCSVFLDIIFWPPPL